MSLEKKLFGCTHDTNEDVYELTLTNKNGMSVKLITFGAAMKNIFVKDKDGAMRDVLLGHDELSEYEKSTYQGAVIGRVANRIAGGKFTLDGTSYQLAVNNEKNHLHGGNKGYNMRNWKITECIASQEPSVTLSLIDTDMTENYPGTVKISVAYTLTSANEIKLHYLASTDKKTLLNVTNHSYFNLNGYNSGTTILEQFVSIDADNYTPLDENFIPTGEIKNVGGTAFDFRKPKEVQQDLYADDITLKNTNGYDINFMLNSNTLAAPCAVAYSNESKIRLNVSTDMPCMQFYIGNFLDGTDIGKDNKPMEFRTGFCFETQYPPDSCNHPNLIPCVLEPGNVFDHTTVFRFDTL